MFAAFELRQLDKFANFVKFDMVLHWRHKVED